MSVTLDDYIRVSRKLRGLIDKGASKDRIDNVKEELHECFERLTDDDIDEIERDFEENI
jgi:hypothetical protein